MILKIVRCACFVFCYCSSEDLSVTGRSSPWRISHFGNSSPLFGENPSDHACGIVTVFWAILSRIWSNRRSALLIEQPDTIVRWNRQGFNIFWR